MTEIICPYCEQDRVWKVSIEDARGVGSMCFECDTVWHEDKKIDCKSGLNFELLMEQKGKKADWAKVKKLCPATS